MNYYNGIKLEYKNQKRSNYMSQADLYQDLSTDCLIKILPTLNMLNSQMVVISKLENRVDEIGEEKLFELLESCNGK